MRFFTNIALNVWTISRYVNDVVWIIESIAFSTMHSFSLQVPYKCWQPMRCRHARTLGDGITIVLPYLKCFDTSISTYSSHGYFWIWITKASRAMCVYTRRCNMNSMFIVGIMRKQAVPKYNISFHENRLCWRYNPMSWVAKLFVHLGTVKCWFSTGNNWFSAPVTFSNT